jgi:hypothetical protein
MLTIGIANKYDSSRSSLNTHSNINNLKSNNTSRNLQHNEDTKTPSVLHIINTSPDISFSRAGIKTNIDEKPKNRIISPSNKFHDKLFNPKTFKDSLLKEDLRNKTPNQRIKRDFSNPNEKKIKSKSINSDKTNSNINYPKTNTKKKINFAINRWDKDAVKKKQISTNEAVKQTTASSKNNLIYVLDKNKRTDNVKLINKDNRPKSLNTLRTSYNAKL